MLRTFLFFVALSTSFYSQSQNFPIASSANHSGGTYSIYRSDNDSTITINNIRKPIIWVEGFEVSEETSIRENYDLIDIGSNLEEQLHAAGYDIVILNFNDATDYIQRNAKVLEQLIQDINNGKPNNESLVVMGYSMGGLVARYALVEMENNSIDHETRLYVSYDAPHKGAHVPVSVQALALTFNGTSYRTMFPELATILERFESPAARQMLKYRIPSATTADQVLPVSTDHANFMNEINNLNGNGGFPQNCQSVALSLGSWNAVPQRANFDSDENGENDFQYGAFPAVYINFPASSGTGVQAVWDLNTCEAVAAFTFQSFLSTTNSLTYPYYSTRSGYSGLGDYNYATYWYSNQAGFNLLPAGAWSRFFAYDSGEPIDFAPGSLTNSYEQVVTSLNAEVDCSFAYYDNSTFVPTVSALAYNTTDLFYNIGDDQSRLTKTPFSDIFAFCGENQSHTEGIATNAQLVSWVMSKLNNGSANSCYCGNNASITNSLANLCSGGTTFNLVNPPHLSNTTWSVSPTNLVQTSSGSGNTALIRANTTGSGNATVTFRNASCGNSIVRSKTVWAGKPYVTGYLIGGSSGDEYLAYGTSYQNKVCNLTTFYTDMDIRGQSSYTWSRPAANPTNTTWYQSGDGIRSYFYAVGQTATFRLSAVNSCGTTSYDYRFISVSCGSGCSQYSVSPNPSSTEVNIVVPNIPAPCPGTTQTSFSSEQVEEQDGNPLTIKTVNLFNLNGELMLTKQLGDNTKNFKLNLSELRKGVYILKVSDGVYFETHRIVID